MPAGQKVSEVKGKGMLWSPTVWKSGLTWLGPFQSTSTSSSWKTGSVYPLDTVSHLSPGGQSDHQVNKILPDQREGGRPVLAVVLEGVGTVHVKMSNMHRWLIIGS